MKMHSNLIVYRSTVFEVVGKLLVDVSSRVRPLYACPVIHPWAIYMKYHQHPQPPETVIVLAKTV